MYTLMILRLDGQHVHQWNWATSTVSDITPEITAVKDVTLLPSEFSLSQNYPNPFNPTTTISYDIPKKSFVSLKVYDVLGRVIKTLVHQEQSAGNYRVTFNADNLASGVYFYRLIAGNFVRIRKMMLLK